ncbi:alpha/beta hydrolase [Nocardioides sp. BP30]|uniref:alpha/beta hydrolase n=1 Tax=Nocardioides sp. BP30 TaxID=3036374 RepID=UPI0024696D83|nr:alpha/beta hydrolase [Nocardioides sp. BP30]WGL51491.1 alpha/beta hydrolase [Nocardioides sp. BP30]
MRRSFRSIAVKGALAALVGAGLATVGAPIATAHAAAPQPTEQQIDQAATRVSAAQPARLPAYNPPSIKWGRCADTGLRKAHAVCGMLIVPLDYKRPHGTKIKLAVSKIKHKTSAAKYQGVMLVNPGGPGGSGLRLSQLGAAVPHGGGKPYDWIGFDPRGVGQSKPALRCDDDYLAGGRPSYDPAAGTEAFWSAKTAAYAHACKKESPARARLLRHDHTTDSVADMESLRKALHASKINYYGFSYGTYLGQVYATLHPNRVRRFVLDGVVDPRDVWYQSNLAQDTAFEANADTFFDWVAANDPTYHLGTSGTGVRQLYYTVLANLSQHPINGFGAADWNDVFTGAGYYVYDWDAYAHILVSAQKGDLAPAKAMYGDQSGPGADNEYAGYLAVQCTDASSPSWSQQLRDAAALAPRAPFLTWNNTWFNAPCRDWPVKPTRPVHVTGRHVPPILLIEETHDAATPWAGAIEVRKRFPKARLIEGVDGTTHAGSLSGVRCTDDRIAAYLLHGKLFKRKHGADRADLRCPPVPTPVPTPVSASGASSSRLAPGSTTVDPLGSLRSLIETAALGGR